MGTVFLGLAVFFAIASVIWIFVLNSYNRKRIEYIEEYNDRWRETVKADIVSKRTALGPILASILFFMVFLILEGAF